MAAIFDIPWSDQVEPNETPPPHFQFSHGDEDAAWRLGHSLQDTNKDNINPWSVPIASFEDQHCPAHLNAQCNVLPSGLNHEAFSSPLQHNHGFALLDPSCTPAFPITPARHGSLWSSSMVPTSFSCAEYFDSPGDTSAVSRTQNLYWNGYVTSCITPFEQRPFQNDYLIAGPNVTPLNCLYQPSIADGPVLATDLNVVRQGNSSGMHHAVEMRNYEPITQVWDQQSPDSEFSSSMTIPIESGKENSGLDPDWQSALSCDAIARSRSRSLTLSNASKETFAPLHVSKRNAVGKQAHRVEKKKTKRPSNGSHGRQKVTRRQGSLQKAAREKAAIVRHIGSCIRCRLYHVSCDESNPCYRCTESLINPRVFFQPCLRAKLTTLHFVRHGFGRFDQHDAHFLNYLWVDAYGKVQDLSFEWYLPGAKQRLALELPVRRYVVNDMTDDTNTYHWCSSGEVGSVRVPPFACPDIKLVQRKVRALIKQSRNEIGHWLSQRYHDDEVLLKTYEEADRYRKRYGSQLIGYAFELQHGTILSQGAGSVLPESLPALLGEFGCDDISVRKAFDTDDAGQSRPVPLAVQHQIEVAILFYVNETQQKFRRELERRFFQPNPKPWFEIFLTIFILLKNLDFIYTAALRYKRICTQTMLESQVNSVIRKMVEEYKYAAKIVFYHFRYILRGPIPFQLARETPDSLRDSLPELDEPALAYLRNLAVLLERPDNPYTSRDADDIDSSDGDPDGVMLFELFRTLSDSGP